MEKKKTLADFGCCFRVDKLRTIEGEGGIVEVFNRKEYVKLNEAIDDAVYEMVEKEGLQRRYIREGRLRRFYFASPCYEKKGKILVLIHGSNSAKAGQWSRTLITKSLSRGSQMDYIRRGLANNWGVVVLNYNDNCEDCGDWCHGAREHALAEWAHAISDSVRGPIVIAAHGGGGDIAAQVVSKMHFKSDCRVVLVGLIDSSSKITGVCAVNWNMSMKKLHYDKESGAWQMFAGDDSHEGTPSACFNSIFALMEPITSSTSNSQFQSLLKKSEEIVYDDFKKKMMMKKKELRVKDANVSLEPEEEMKKNEEKMDTDENEKRNTLKRKRVSFADDQNSGISAAQSASTKPVVHPSTQTTVSPTRSILKTDNSDAHNLLSIAMDAMKPAKRIKFSNDLLAFLTESCEKYCEIVPDEFKD